jgi:hypothetical protein
LPRCDGTSLPELASSIITARKGEYDIGFGEHPWIKSFNTLAVVGIAGDDSPLASGAGSLLPGHDGYGRAHSACMIPHIGPFGGCGHSAGQIAGSPTKNFGAAKMPGDWPGTGDSPVSRP